MIMTAFCNVYPVAALSASVAAIALVAALHPAAHAAQPGWKIEFERAEFVLSSAATPPDHTGAWAPVALPDEWRRRVSGGMEQGWYRITFDLAKTPATTHAILVSYLRSREIEYFVNGRLVGGSGHVSATNAAGTLLGPPVYITVTPHLLRAGKNVIHVRMHATSAGAAIHGLGRITFGEAREVRKPYISRIEQEAQALHTFFAMAFAAGLIALCLWFARPGDRVMLLLAFTYLSWAFVAGWQRPLRWIELPQAMRSIIQVYLSYGLPALSVLLCLRTARVRWPRFETSAWAYLVVVITLPIWQIDGTEAWRLVLDAVNTGLLLTAAVALATYARRPLRWSAVLQIATLFLMAVLISSEFARYLGWTEPDSPSIRHFHVLAMIVGVGAAVFAEHVLDVWRAESMNVALVQRVDEKTREIEANRVRLERARREQALAGERQRIITDMHDGLGASLVGLLRYVQAQRGDPAIEQRVKESLQELRIAIDALEPAEGDLATVLGNLRYRLEPLLEPAGIRLEWEVGELPRVESLEPSAVFALQRIVLEAVANALKHSGAVRVRLSAKASASGEIEIRIEDDGRGFDAMRSSLGLGLANMRARAARIGAQLEITSRTGAGTIVRLQIPRLLELPPQDLESGQPGAHSLQGLVPAPDTA